MSFYLGVNTTRRPKLSKLLPAENIPYQWQKNRFTLQRNQIYNHSQNQNQPESRINAPSTCTGHWLRTMKINIPLAIPPSSLHRTSCTDPAQDKYIPIKRKTVPNQPTS